MTIDPKIKQWATPRQAEYIDAVNECGTYGKASTKLGVARQTLSEGVVFAKANATRHGYSPEHNMTQAVPDGYKAKGVSTYYNSEGEVKAQWVKSQIDEARQAEIVREMIGAMTRDIPPIPVTSAPLDWQSDVIPWIQIGDAHLGMLAYSNETGENFDLKIAETELCTAIAILIDELPNCERIVVNDLGDFSHYQNYNATSESGHQFDFDTRFPKMIRVCSAVMRFIVERALTKAAHVDVIINQGNHSRTNDIWMAELLKVAYGHTGRVHILNNECIFIGYRMGNTFVMTNHSDKCRPQHLANVMTTDFRKDYGETEFHYIDIGHIHHNMVLKEHPGVVIESFNHLASLDKWAHDSGYRNRKSITIILRSKTYGEVGRRLLPIQEVRARMTESQKQPPSERKVYTI